MAKKKPVLHGKGNPFPKWKKRKVQKKGIIRG